MKKPFPALAVLTCALSIFVTSLSLRAQETTRGAVGGPGPDHLVYTAPDGVKFTITADGLTTIDAGTVGAAHGIWRAFNDEKSFGLGEGDVKLPAPTEKTFDKLGDNSARVRHVQGACVVTYTYSFKGNDIDILARIENNDEAHPLKAVSFGGLRFKWNGAAHDNFLRAAPQDRAKLGLDAFYPSRLMRVGGGFATDGEFGLGISPLAPGPQSGRWTWYWARDGAAQANLLRFCVADQVSPLGGRVFRLRLRAAATGDWKVLFAPYKAYFGSGDLQFKPDARPFAYTEIESETASITPGNPRGFRQIRPDKPDEAVSWLNALLPQLKKINAQALIVRGLNGSDVRGVDYVFNPLGVAGGTAEQTFPRLKPILDGANVRLGFVAQPNHFNYRLNWTQSAVRPIDVSSDTEPLHWFYQLNQMKGWGLPVAYFTHFGGTGDDLRALQYYHGRLPDMTFITDDFSDATLPLAAGVVHLSPLALKGRGWQPDLPDGQLEILRWLVPNAQFVARFDSAPAQVAGDLQWAKQNNFTPMITVRSGPRAVRD